MVGGLGTLVLELELPSDVLGEVMSGLSEVEHRSNFATREHLQIAAMVGVFVKARGMITPMGGGE